MSRYLFVVPPWAGHVNATVAVGTALAGRGHEVAWAGHERAVAPLLPGWARLIPIPGDADRLLREALRTRAGLRGPAALRFLWDDVLVPLAVSMAPGVDEAVAGFRPDALVVDQQALAGAVVARRRGLPWATSATTSAEVVGPVGLLPKVGEWIAGRLDDLQRRLGVPEAARRDPRFSEHLVLVYSTEALVGPLERFPDHYAFVGPALGGRPVTAGFPWERLDPSRRQLLVSLGTLNDLPGRRFLGAVAEALGDARLAGRVQATMVAPPGVLDAAAPNLLVRERVPQLDLLARMDAVVCHAGHNTVCEALASGVPLVVAPILDDQPLVAQQVVDAGAGVRLRFGRARAADVAAAVTAVLDDPAFGAAARRVRASFGAAGGADAAADHLEKLA